MRNTENRSSVWTAFNMVGCDSMSFTLLSAHSLHNNPVKKVLLLSK